MSEYVDVAIIENGKKIGTFKCRHVTSFVLKDITRICKDKDEAQKTALYNLDGWRKAEQELEKAKARIQELETQIKQMNEREAQDIRARFPC